MTVLRDLQEAMQACVLENDLSVSDAIIEPGNMTVEQRLRVYRNGYYFRLVEILVGDFTVLHAIMGEAAFSAMARDYLDAYPSHHFSVRTVGCHLVAFLKNTKDCDPCYRELAAFEWALNQALFAREMPVLTMEMLSTIPAEQWAEMHLHLHPSVQVIYCHYNTVARWQAISKEQTDKGTMQLPEPLYHMVWRHDDDACFFALTMEQYYVISALQQGQNFTALCETMMTHLAEDEVAPWVASTLQEWVQQDVFVSSPTVNF